MQLIRSTYYFMRDVIDKRSIIYELVKRDLQQQYVGSYFGALWLFLQPLLYIFILYMVFTVGFRAGLSGNMPFSLYLITGMVSWIYFSENLSANTGVINKHSYMVKKVNFRLSVLPVVTMVSSMASHVLLLIIAVGVSWFNGYPPTLYTIQIAYYFFAMFMLLLGLAWLTSSSSLFVRDVSNVVSIVLQFGVWLTPILWNIDMIPERYRWIVELNPMNYIVTGYRDSIVSQVAFWERGGTVYYWLFTLVTLYLGIGVFRRLRPHFAEVV